MLFVFFRTGLGLTSCHITGEGKQAKWDRESLTAAETKCGLCIWACPRKRRISRGGRRLPRASGNTLIFKGPACREQRGSPNPTAQARTRPTQGSAQGSAQDAAQDQAARPLSRTLFICLIWNPSIFMDIWWFFKKSIDFYWNLWFVIQMHWFLIKNNWFQRTPCFFLEIHEFSWKSIHF